MQEFGLPFFGLANESCLKEEKHVIATRVTVAGEYKAIQLYMQLAESTDKLAVEVPNDSADDERVRVGALLRLLREIAADEEKFYIKGAREVE